MDDDSAALGNDCTNITANESIGNVESENFSKASRRDVNVAEGGNGDDEAQQQVNNGILSPGSKKRVSEVDDTEEPLPTLPLKRARTAYFVFVDEKREEVKQQHPGEGVATIAKAIGQLWSRLLPTEKEVYETKAAEERVRVSRDMKRLVDAGLWPESRSGANTDVSGSRTGETNNDDDAVLFPVARIRKICKLDPDVKGISKESALLITKATELFCTKLAKECVIMAQMQNRRKLLPEDVVEVCSVKEAFMFLRSDLVDLRKTQIEEMNLKEKENGKERGSGGGTKEEEGGTTKTNTLDSYFGKVRH